MSYEYKAAERYWENFYELPNSQKEAVRRAWRVFRKDPFHPSLGTSLGTHKIHRLSAVAKETVYSVVVEGDLRVLFVIRGNIIYTLDVGTHKVYD